MDRAKEFFSMVQKEYEDFPEKIAKKKRPQIGADRLERRRGTS